MNKKLEYFPMVDFFRGLGALVILVWHYHHFYFTKPYFSPETGNPTWVFEAQPFHSMLWLFYHHGYWAVQFFWVLSGFVFAHVYINKATNFRNFFILRFSRLYPLHFITLLTIACLQILSSNLFSKYQILAINDWYHFVLHLFFASNWGLEVGYSFNSPVWSISVEEVAYWCFWIAVARVGKLSSTKAILLLLLSILARKVLGQIGSCFFYFIAGAVTYKLFSICMNWRRNLMIAAGLIIASFFAIGYNKMTFGMVSLFCGMVLVAASADQSGYFKKFDSVGLFVGSVTYSTYLWHLPVQVAVLIVFELFAINRTFFNHPAVLIGFLMLMIYIGRVSYLKIERPLQLNIRKKYLNNN